MSKEESLPIGGYAEKAYLEYSMYVILDRALPFVGDGLKPCLLYTSDAADE